MLKPAVAILASLAISAVEADAGPENPSLGAPDEATVRKLEANMRLPAGARPLTEYDRYYAYEMEGGRLLIEGVLRGKQGATATVRRLPRHQDLPTVADGGCDIVHVWWDVKAGKQIAAGCNGLA